MLLIQAGKGEKMISKVGRSRSGLPTFTESGGATTSKRSAIIICGPNGEKVVPLFVPKRYSNGDHAIFVAKVGMHIVSCDYDHGSEKVVVYKVAGIGGDIQVPIPWGEMLAKKYAGLAETECLPGESYRGLSGVDIKNLYGVDKPTRTEHEPDLLQLEKIAEIENNNGNIPGPFISAVEAAKAKGRVYHCRSVFYAI
jgi:hypothetical protein